MVQKTRTPTKPTAPPSFQGPLSGRLNWRLVVILASTVLAYASAMTSPLLFDDQASIVSNTSIRRLTPLSGPLSPPRETPVAGRPLVNLTLAINYATDGLAVRSYHVTNLVIHVLVAFTLFGVVRRGLRMPRIPRTIAAQSENLAFATALLWALHPLNSEVVNYLTQRSESMMALFAMLTVYASMRAVETHEGLKWTVIAFVSCAAGMACKESMAVVPLLVVLIDRVVVFDSWRATVWSRRGLYAGLASGWLVLIVLVWSVPRTSVGFDAGVSPWTYLLNQAQLIPRYLWLAIWPRELVLDYGVPRALVVGQVWTGLALMGVLVALTIVALWRRPLLGLLGSWFFVTLAPASSFVPVATEVGAERRMYLPLMAIVLLVVLAAQALVARIDAGRTLPSKTRSPLAFGLPALMLAAVCALMVLGLTRRNREYTSPLTMAQTIVDRWPNGRGHYLLGYELIAAGRTGEAIAQFRESARDYPGALFALGTELVAAGKIDEGVVALEGFIKGEPQDTAVVPARELLSRVYFSQNKLAPAEEQLRLLIARVPNHAGAHRLMGDLHLRQNNPEQAIVDYRESLRVQPGQAGTLVNLGYALSALNRFDEAADVMRRAVVLAPADPGSHFLLGRILAMLRQHDAAQKEFEAALQLDPANAEVRASLESVRRMR